MSGGKHPALVMPHNHTGRSNLFGCDFRAAARGGVPAGRLWPPQAPGRDGLVRDLLWALIRLLHALRRRVRSYYLLPCFRPRPADCPVIAAPASELVQWQPGAARSGGWLSRRFSRRWAWACCHPPGCCRLRTVNSATCLIAKCCLAWIVGCSRWASQRRYRCCRPSCGRDRASSLRIHFLFRAARPGSSGRARPSAEVRTRTEAPRKLALLHARDVVFDLGERSPNIPMRGPRRRSESGRVRWVLVRRRYFDDAGFFPRKSSWKSAATWKGRKLGDKLLLLKRRRRSAMSVIHRQLSACMPGGG